MNKIKDFLITASSDVPKQSYISKVSIICSESLEVGEEGMQVQPREFLFKRNLDPALGRHRQSELWSSLTGQPSQMGEHQVQ